MGGRDGGLIVGNLSLRNHDPELLILSSHESLVKEKRTTAIREEKIHVIRASKVRTVIRKTDHMCTEQIEFVYSMITGCFHLNQSSHDVTGKDRLALSIRREEKISNDIRPTYALSKQDLSDPVILPLAYDEVTIRLQLSCVVFANPTIPLLPRLNIPRGTPRARKMWCVRTGVTRSPVSVLRFKPWSF